MNGDKVINRILQTEQSWYKKGCNPYIIGFQPFMVKEVLKNSDSELIIEGIGQYSGHQGVCQLGNSLGCWLNAGLLQNIVLLIVCKTFNNIKSAESMIAEKVYLGSSADRAFGPLL